MDHSGKQNNTDKRAARSHLSVVAVTGIEDPIPTVRGHRSIGRLIAQTALIADTARAQHNEKRERQRGRLGWFL